MKTITFRPNKKDQWILDNFKQRFTRNSNTIRESLNLLILQNKIKTKDIPNICPAHKNFFSKCGCQATDYYIIE